MALSGVHIEFGSVNVGSPVGGSYEGLLGECTVSQTMTSAGTTTVAAPPGSSGGQKMSIYSISASAAIFYAVGQNPNATTGARRYMDQTFGRQDGVCGPGDKIDWIFVP